MSLSGRGAHTGRDSRLTLSPASADSGIVFIVDGREIDAHWSLIEATRLHMRLSSQGAQASTVEHVLAALAGLGVDNALVHLVGDEAPAMDGSAREYVDAIDKAGLVLLDVRRRFLRVVAPVRVSDGPAWAELAPTPASQGLSLDVEIAFPSPIGRQRRALSLTPDRFRQELACARSFGFLREAEGLWRQGLALGACLENTLVYDNRRVLNPYGERFSDECVRHKMLDVVGDLGLAGLPIIGAFRSFHGGHGLNLALLKAAFAAGAFEREGAIAVARLSRHNIA